MAIEKENDNIITETKSDGSIVTTITNEDGSKTVTTVKTDGSEYTKEISSDGNTTTIIETKSANVSDNTNSLDDNPPLETNNSEFLTKSAVEIIKGAKSYAPNELIAENCTIEIDGFQFVAEELKAGESYPRRNLVRTSIMGGGEQTLKGEYIPRSYSFSTSINYTIGSPDEYDKLWELMQNKECSVVSQFTGNFTAEVKILKTYPKGMGNTVKLDITLTEISKTDNTYIVKTDMTDFTTITDNTDENIKTMEDEQGNTVTIQTNVSEKHTEKLTKTLKEVTKSTNTTSSSNGINVSLKKNNNENYSNNTEEYVGRDVIVKL